MNYFTSSNSEVVKFLLQILPSYWGEPARASAFPSVVGGGPLSLVRRRSNSPQGKPRAICNLMKKGEKGTGEPITKSRISQISRNLEDFASKLCLNHASHKGRG